MSYGWPEALTCEEFVTHAHCTSGNAAAYVAKAELELKKLGAIGVTVVVCSQDEGAPSEHNTACLFDLIGKPVWPVYPGSSAYVTSVSGTTLLSNTARGPSPQSAAVERDALPPICSKGHQCSVNGTTEVRVCTGAILSGECS